MKKISKKAISITLILVFLALPCFVSAQSADTLDKSNVVTFDENAYQDLPLIEKGKAKLREAGTPEKFINRLSSDKLEKAGASQKIINTKSYFIELCQPQTFSRSAEPNFTMKQVTESEFETAIANEQHTIKPFNDVGIEIDGPVTSINNGKLIINCDAINLGGNHYLIIGGFQWVTMPTYRGTDYFSFVIKDSSNWSTDANSASVEYYYLEQSQLITKNAQGALVYGNPSQRVVTVEIPSQKMKSPEGPLKGYYCDMPVPKNTRPLIIGAGPWINFDCWDFTGLFAMSGILQTNKRIDTQTAYFHQTKSLVFSPSVSLASSLSIGVSISPESKFESCRQELNIPS